MTIRKINDDCRDKFWERRRDEAVAAAERAVHGRWRSAVERVRSSNDYRGLVQWRAGFDAAISRILAEVEGGE